MKRKFKYVLLSICTLLMAAFGIACGEEACEHEYGAKPKEITKVATCTTRGEEIWTCLHCGEDKKVATDTVSHTFDDGVTKTPATCTQAGEILYSCINCEGTKVETIKKLEHIVVQVEQVNPTCTTDGHTAYSYCTECNEFLIPKVVMPASGHVAVPVKGTPATCTTSGMTDGSKCGVCGYIFLPQETIKAKGHTPVTVPGVEPSCVPGKTPGVVCSTCGEVLVAQTELPPISEHTIITEPAVAATCTTDGNTESSSCSTCGAVLQTATVIPAAGHQSVIVEGVEPSCADGKSQGEICSVCGAVLKAQEVIPATGEHVLVEKADSMPTCTTDGWMGRTDCSVCRKTISRTVLKSSGHNYNDEGICLRCEAETFLIYEIKTVQSFLMKKDVAVVTGVRDKTIESVVVPTTYNGVEVAQIGERAFEGCTNLNSITLSNKITSIHDYAFSGCGTEETPLVLNMQSAEPPTVYSNSFADATLKVRIVNTAAIIVYGRDNVVADYKNQTYWKDLEII